MVQQRSHNLQSCPQDVPDGLPPKKRPRVDAPQKHRANIISNFDELYIIFAHVYPMDLLNLARTCKYLRSILMHKSSQPLWKAALRRADKLPDCPVDLTEPQYTNLVFYNHCHGCNKPTTTILWELRRRYCPDCIPERLCHFSSCDPKLRCILPRNQIVKRKDGLDMYFDKEQSDRLLVEYYSSASKESFIAKKRQEYLTLREHAFSCRDWQKEQGSQRFDLELLRKEREASILDRLEQHGYGPEVAYYKKSTIRNTCQSIFDSYERLAHHEWNEAWPKWIDSMNELRFRRLDDACYQARRVLLISEYDKYVRRLTPDTSAFSLLPHVVDLTCFSPFKNIIEAPEEAQMGEEPFASAFAQLPAFLPEWKKQLDARLAELVNIPSDLTQQDTSSAQVTESSSAASQKLYQMDSTKLRLACALFECDADGYHEQLFAYPQLLFIPTLYTSEPLHYEVTRMRNEIIRRHFMIRLFEEAPYIVHACGLDPNLATVDDMDHRNARLKCLVCKPRRTIVMNWRDAMLHARAKHDFLRHSRRRLLPLSESPRWGLVDDHHIEAIEAVEKSIETEQLHNSPRRCLLCQPRVRDGFDTNFGPDANFIHHMEECHGVNATDIEQDHYEFLGFNSSWAPKKVEMVNQGGRVIFR